MRRSTRASKTNQANSVPTNNQLVDDNSGATVLPVKRTSRRAAALKDISNKEDSKPKCASKVAKDRSRVNSSKSSMEDTRLAVPVGSTVTSSSSSSSSSNNPVKVTTKTAGPGFKIHEDRLEPAEIVLPPPEPSKPVLKNQKAPREDSDETGAEVAIPEQTNSCSKKRKRSETETNPSIVETVAETGTEVTSSVGKENFSDNSLKHARPASNIVTSWEKPRRVKPRSTNPNDCDEILDKLYERWYIQEKEFTAQPYLDKQNDINAKMRAILVDWLVEVHYKFKLHASTLWLTVNIVDRYLEKKQTLRAKLQLVGVASLFIACKFEEIYPPEVNDCVYITDNAYTREAVLEMEGQILQTLNYQICVPTGYHFMMRYLNFINASSYLRYLSFYYAERNLQEYDMLNIPPHKFAASALFAALHHTSLVNPHGPPRKSVWTIELAELTGFTEADLLFCAANILKHVQEETVTASKRQLIATKKKYSVEKYFNISALPIPRLGNQMEGI